MQATARKRTESLAGSSDGSPADNNSVDSFHHNQQQQHNTTTNNHQTQTHEKGVITRESGASRFIGSSSGVYFLNLVREAFTTTTTLNDLNTDQTIYDTEYLSGRYEDREDYEDELGQQTVGPIARHIGEQLIMPYFRYFHPLLPFLDGNQFRKDFEAHVYTGKPASAAQACAFKAVLSVGLVEYPELSGVLTPERDWFSGGARDARAHAVALIGAPVDTAALEALLAVQVYLFASMQIRGAYELGGLVRPKMFVGGFHRCPARYPGMFKPEECTHRKRILWSAYALDHHLSQVLGLPIGYTDTDIDVCPLLIERHVHGGDIPEQEPPDLEEYQSIDLDGHIDGNSYINDPLKVARAFSEYHRLVGRVVETFNKSLHVRTVDPRGALSLQADIERWWNGLPDALVLDSEDINMNNPREEDSGNDSNSYHLPFDNACFFTVLYHQVVLLVNRPRLSLPASTPEFRYAIQAGVDCGRRILAAMSYQERHYGATQAFFWPGYLSAVWNAGLMISFACKLGCYPLARGIREVRRCLPLCDAMLRRWPAAARCRNILQTILNAMENTPDHNKTNIYNSSGTNSIYNNANNNSTNNNHPHYPYNNTNTTIAEADIVLDAAAAELGPVSANTDFIEPQLTSAIDFDDDVFNLFSMEW